MASAMATVWRLLRRPRNALNWKAEGDRGRSPMGGSCGFSGANMAMEAVA